MPVLDQNTISTISHATKIDAIVEKVKKSECILFLGAGVHFHSPDGSPYAYSAGDCPPMGSKFSADLAKDCEFMTHFPKGDVGNLQRVSLCYEITNDRQALVEEVKKAVQTGKKPSPALYALAKLPFSLIITTNYDQLLEKALRDVGKNPNVGVYNKDSYAFHPVPETFRYNFKRWPTLFVGYSLLDYNLRLLFKTLRWKMDKAKFPTTYSVDPYPDPLIFDVWYNQNKYVTFIAQDVWNFVPELYRMVTGKDWTQDPDLYRAIMGKELPK